MSQEGDTTAQLSRADRESIRSVTCALAAPSDPPPLLADSLVDRRLEVVRTLAQGAEQDDDSAMALLEHDATP